MSEAAAPLCSLKLECEKLVSEKTEMQRHYVMVSSPLAPCPPKHPRCCSEAAPGGAEPSPSPPCRGRLAGALLGAGRGAQGPGRSRPQFLAAAGCSAGAAAAPCCLSPGAVPGGSFLFFSFIYFFSFLGFCETSVLPLPRRGAGSNTLGLGLRGSELRGTTLELLDAGTSRGQRGLGVAVGRKGRGRELQDRAAFPLLQHLAQPAPLVKPASSHPKGVGT